MIHGGLPSCIGLRLEDGHVPTFLLLLYMSLKPAVMQGAANVNPRQSSTMRRRAPHSGLRTLTQNARDMPRERNMA